MTEHARPPASTPADQSNIAGESSPVTSPLPCPAWCAGHDENPLRYMGGEASFNHVRILAEGHWIRPELPADQPERAMVQIRQFETLNAQDRSATAYLPGAELVVFSEDPTKGLWSVVLEFAGPCELLAVASAMIHAAAMLQAAEPIDPKRGQ